jgi:hypothetical protein
MIKLYRNYGDFLRVAADASFVTLFFVTAGLTCDVVLTADFGAILFAILACLVAEAAALCFSINLTTSVVR